MYNYSGKEEVAAHVDIENNGFFPNVSTAPFVEEYRIPSDIPAETIKSHIVSAMFAINFQLREFKTEQIELGNNTLTAVPADHIGGVNEKVHLYKRAVFCEAKSEILKETQTVSRTKDAENLAKSAEETEDKYREWAADAVRQLIGQSRVTVEVL